MDRVELKSQAKQQIKGNIGILFAISLIISLIAGVSSLILEFIPFGIVAYIIIIAPAFTLSLINIYLGVAAGKKPTVSDAFSGFNDFWPAFKVTFLTGLFTFLWSLLFIIPGIVKSYAYSMSLYILAENKDKPALECIRESEAMTKGYKGDLFVLGLSFIGWIIVTYLTLGIAYIWVMPYMQTTFTNAYNCLKNKNTQIVCEPDVIPENLQIENAVENIGDTDSETAEEIVEADNVAEENVGDTDNEAAEN